jgi:hypothetical protein
VENDGNNNKLTRKQTCLPPWVEESLTPAQRAIMTETNAEKVLDFMHVGAEETLKGIRSMIVAYCRAMQLGIPRDAIVLPNKYLQRMVYGQVLPELVVNAAGCPEKVLRLAANLPLPDQKRFAENEPIKVVESGGDFRMVPALSLSSKQVDQVIGEGGLRTETEQAHWPSPRNCNGVARSVAANRRCWLASSSPPLPRSSSASPGQSFPAARATLPK